MENTDMNLFTNKILSALVWGALLGSLSGAIVQPAVAQGVMRYEDIVRNLRHADPDIRLSSLRMLAEAGYPEAIGPVAALLSDPVDRIQAEALRTELKLFMAEPLSTRKRVGLIVEVRDPGSALDAFERGPHAVLPRDVPPELIRGLIAATKDVNPRLQLEAIYALGVIAPAPGAKPIADRLVVLLSSDSRLLRLAAARVAGRLRAPGTGEALVQAMNDPRAEIRIAAMLALGDLREATAVEAITARVEHYGSRAEGDAALEALARIGSPQSVPVFAARLAGRDAVLRRLAAEGLGRAADTGSAQALESALTAESSAQGRLAMTFALLAIGKGNAHPLIEALANRQLADQARGYLVELGPSIVPAIKGYLANQTPLLKGALADVLGAIGGSSASEVLQTLKNDADPGVVASVERALERIRIGRAGPRAEPPGA
jgi:HEAT repeat protein